MAAVIAVCGLKNSGKTTFISKLTESFSKRGLTVAVIKHDGHDFDCDIPGTDTYRFTGSGAYGVACYSENRVFIHKTRSSASVDDLVQLFPEADIIFVEGLKDSSLDKVEVIRKEISDGPVSNPDGRFLIASDLPCGSFDEQMIDIDDTDKAVSIILEKARL